MIKMYSTVKGVFKNGIVQITEPVKAQEGEIVLITFLDHKPSAKRGSLKGIWGKAKVDDALLQAAKHSVFSYEK